MRSIDSVGVPHYGVRSSLLRSLVIRPRQITPARLHALRQSACGEVCGGAKYTTYYVGSWSVMLGLAVSEVEASHCQP